MASLDGLLIEPVYDEIIISDYDKDIEEVFFINSDRFSTTEKPVLYFKTKNGFGLVYK